jgi:predicted GIY-YIG superfamily endonuclease
MKEYIYVLKCQDAIKVGYTTNLEQRIKSHKTSNPFAEFVCSYEAPMYVEKLIHKKLSKHLKKDCTEWFNYHSDIYNDIEAIVKKEVSEVVVKGNTPKQQSFKVFNFKDNKGNNAIVCAKNLARALKILAYDTFTKPIYHAEIEFNDTIKDTEYIIKSSFLTKKEYVFCKRNLIDINNEYGLTYNRFVNLMTKDNTIIPEDLWNKSIKTTYNKTYKNTKTGRRKKKFNR